MSNPFNKEHFNSGDGMLTSIWGPSMWHSLHTISFNYPTNPSNEQKKNYLDFFMSLKHVLPCKYCRINYVKNIKSVPLNMSTMKNRYTVSKWLYELHEEINRLLGKKSNLSYEDIQKRYENFRARCIEPKKTKRKSKKEKGCVKPLYGKKSKCVIHIVPKNKKCKTFNIDKRCVIKK